MRFKIIFFPLAVLICVWVSIKWIWPETVRIGELKKEKIEKQKILDSHIAEKSKIESLKNDIDSNKSEESAALRFFPVQKNEENIFNSINYLAANSSVNLDNMSLEDGAAAAPKAAAPVQSMSSSKNDLFSPESENFISQNEVTDPTRFTNAAIKVSGNYKNIKIFLNQIYSLPIFNKINSVSISKAAAGGDAEAGKKAPLSMDVNVGFGYKPAVAIKGNSALPYFPNSSFDFTYIKKIENSNIKVTPIADSGLGSTGRENPFMP